MLRKRRKLDGDSKPHEDTKSPGKMAAETLQRASAAVTLVGNPFIFYVT